MEFYLLLMVVAFFVGFCLGFILGCLSATKRYNDTFYDFGFISGYNACRNDLLEEKK